MLANDFRERWTRQRYFFVHIPKTGGTSLFDWFRRVYGAHNCCEHIESLILPQPSEQVVDYLLQFRALSGHVPIDFFYYFAEGNFTPLTLMREPVDQFFSHVNHIQTETVEDPFLHRIRGKMDVSVGHFLENATPEELTYFESSQSKPIFGGNVDWRSLRPASRMDWLRQTYGAVVTTETMDEELGWIFGKNDPAVADLPRLNVKYYRRPLLTRRQQQILDGLLREDTVLHQALLELAIV